MDRNHYDGNTSDTYPGSLSARRAWIEILCLMLPLRGLGVALRKESVDRNLLVSTLISPARLSLSARRAWIEMYGVLLAVCLLVVSLSARRAWIEIQ